MANISYGVNIIPKTNNAYTLGNSNYKWSNIYTNQINGTNVEDLASNSSYYITPESYGAVGDGTTDDSAAIQDAIDAGYDIYFPSNKTYYVASAISITHDCHLHGGLNTIIKTKTPNSGTINHGFLAQGTLKTTTTLTDDYYTSNISETANSSNRFELTDMSDVEIGDIMVITATDQYYSYNRQYYYLGATLLVSDIDDDYIYTSDTMPWDIENTNNVSVKIYSAPTVIIEDLHFESDLDSNGTYRYCIYLDHCKNSVVRNCHIREMDNGVCMNECVNTLVDGVSVAITPGIGEQLKDHYGIAVYSSSNTHITRVMSECANSCIDLSGNIPNINTYISHCNLFGSNRVDGLGMHENAYNTVVTDCVLGGVVGYGPMTIQRCRFVQRRRQANSGVGISYRGSHVAKYATLVISDCIFEGNNLSVNLPIPVPQSPIQAYDHIIDSVRIENCIGGRLQYTPSTSSTILSNTVNHITLINWKDCYEFYHTTAPIKELCVYNCTFERVIWMNDHSNNFSQNNIDYLYFSNNCPQQEILGISGEGYGGQFLLKHKTYVEFIEDENSPANNHYIVCGRNIASNQIADYDLGSLTASQGSAISRTPNVNYASALTVNSNGELVFTRTNSNSIYIWQKCFLYLREASDVYMRCTLQNTGETSGSSFRFGIIVIDPDTQLVRSHQQCTAVSATEAGAVMVHSKVQIPAHSLIQFYIQSNNGTSGDETTIKDFIIYSGTDIPAIITYNIEYNGSSIDGAGYLYSVPGINNIMSSSYTFNRWFLIDQISGINVLADSEQPGLMSSADKVKLDGIPTGTNIVTKTDIMTGATSSAAGASGLVPAPATTDVDKFLAGDGTYKSGGLPMVILSYGSSTWAEFEAAYNNNVIVYCRASSNSNPASGSQTRMAFMAYVNNATTPTEVEFQYYRSMNAHSATAMGDQVFVYKLTKTSGWSVTTRDASIKQIKADTGTALGVSWSSNVVTLTNTMTAADMPMSSSDATTTGSAIGTLSYLKTSNKTSTVAAINSFWDEIFNVPTTTLTDVDLDNVRTPGSYKIGSGCTNTPSLNDGKLLVLNTGNENYTRQIYIGGYHYSIYTRNRYYSNGWLWSSWFSLTP